MDYFSRCHFLFLVVYLDYFSMWYELLLWGESCLLGSNLRLLFWRLLIKILVEFMFVLQPISNNTCFEIETINSTRESHPIIAYSFHWNRCSQRADIGTTCTHKYILHQRCWTSRTCNWISNMAARFQVSQYFFYFSS